ncbi:hypothetical protein [Marinomonas sp. IMCC 4694]|uniref:hypothetical protein n=1 Tax=Marinomonas sp. IMCC 4694 TaxID=2605432 RepID=UPI0021CC8BBC|nr:hypothetical protein [Marinomonas sp. IMCC 4694]
MPPQQERATGAEVRSEKTGLSLLVIDKQPLQSPESNKITQEVTQAPKTSMATAKLPLTAAEKLTLSLIEQGEQALLEYRLLTPEGDNANVYFQAALGREPGNYRAIQGIATIVDVYVQWAWEAAKIRGYSKADRYLESAQDVNPHDPTIIEMRSRVSDLMSQRAMVTKQAPLKVTDTKQKDNETGYFLPKTLFSMSEDEIIAQIQPIIDDVVKTESSLAIYWPSDKEARLIYQIINSRVTAFRVRAMIFHRSDYRVELQQNIGG